MKDGKATGVGEIPGKIWRYGGEEIGKWVKEYVKRIWRGEG